MGSLDDDGGLATRVEVRAYNHKRTVEYPFPGDSILTSDPRAGPDSDVLSRCVTVVLLSFRTSSTGHAGHRHARSKAQCGPTLDVKA